MKDLEKMLAKPTKGEMSKEEIQAKLDVLMEMLEMIQSEVGGSVKSGMDEMMAPPVDMTAMSDISDVEDMDEDEEDDDMGLVESPESVSKVEVVADDKEGLEKGLDAAQEIVPKMDEDAVDGDSIFAQKKSPKKRFGFLEG